MKKLLIFMLALGLLSGCGAEGDVAQQSAAPSEEIMTGALSSASVTMASAPEDLCYEVVKTSMSEEWKKGDVVLAQYFYAIPELQVTKDGEVLTEAATSAQQAALDKAAVFNENFAALVSGAEFTKLGQLAQEDYDARQDSGIGWTASYEETFGYTAWQTERLVSVAGEQYGFFGGAHGSTVQFGWNFDLQTGRFLAPATLGADPQQFQAAVTAELVRQADGRAAERETTPTNLYWEDYRETIANWPDYAVYFTEDGMVVAFSAYELANYAEGPQIFTVSYETLTPYLSEDGAMLLGLPEPDRGDS